MFTTALELFLKKENKMKLSNQAIGAVMVTLQKCLAEQSDMVELLREWDLGVKDDEVIILNPPSYKVDKETFATEE